LISGRGGLRPLIRPCQKVFRYLNLSFSPRNFDQRPLKKSATKFRCLKTSSSKVVVKLIERYQHFGRTRVHVKFGPKGTDPQLGGYAFHVSHAARCTVSDSRPSIVWRRFDRFDWLVGLNCGKTIFLKTAFIALLVATLSFVVLFLDSLSVEYKFTFDWVRQYGAIIMLSSCIRIAWYCPAVPLCMTTIVWDTL